MGDAVCSFLLPFLSMSTDTKKSNKNYKILLNTISIDHLPRYLQYITII